MARPEVILVTHNPDILRMPYAQVLERPDWVNGSYSHEDRDGGGFWQCEFKLQRPEDELDYWFENGLDWSVTPVGESGKTLFEGYIDEFEYQKRGIVKRRRLGRMANQVWIRYSDGVTSGLRSTVFNDTLLQEQYGIKQRVFSGSKMLGLGQADQAAEVLFNRVRSAANPSVTSLAKASNQVALTVRCKSWFHKLYWRVYNNPTASGTIAAYALIETMLNSWGASLPVEHRAIQRNDTAVQQKYDVDMTIGDLSMNTASMGDAFSQLWIVGMRERRTVFYESWAPSRLM